jgi:hypothetical protein
MIGKIYVGYVGSTVSEEIKTLDWKWNYGFQSMEQKLKHN